MDYVIPMPMAWTKSDEFDDANTKKQSFNGWRTEYDDCDTALYTQEQVDMLIRQLDRAMDENDTITRQLKNQQHCPQQYVWMIATKTFMALFDTREAAEAAVNSNATASTYIPPVAVPIFTNGVPK